MGRVFALALKIGGCLVAERPPQPEAGGQAMGIA
jgi:hypothetical protein